MTIDLTQIGDRHHWGQFCPQISFLENKSQDMVSLPWGRVYRRQSHANWPDWVWRIGANNLVRRPRKDDHTYLVYDKRRGFV